MDKLLLFSLFGLGLFTAKVSCKTQHLMETNVE